MKYGLICLVFLCHMLRAPGAPRRQKRIAGGFNVTSNKYPWVVALRMHYSATIETDIVMKEFGDDALYIFTYCAGCVLDVYGTVITAAHCVDKSPVRKVGNRTITYELVNVMVKWGSPVSIRLEEDNSRIETVKNLSNIHLHPGSFEAHRNKTRFFMDVALIYLKTFSGGNSINCSSNSTIRPINMSKVNPEIRKNPTVGSVAGFGCQPITARGNEIIGYVRPPYTWLHEHVLEYDGRLDESYEREEYYNSSVNTSSEFYATVKIYDERVPIDLTSGRQFSGTCGGDSGGPYMEDESGETILRGVIRGICRHFCDNDPCTKAGKPATIVDLNYPRIRKWISDMIKLRYFDMRVRGPFPRTC